MKTSKVHTQLVDLWKVEEKRQAEERLLKEAEAEADLLRHIVTEEEWEQQEAEVVERKRVEEKWQRVEDEECQHWEVEHCTEEVRQAQAPELPMWIDVRSRGLEPMM